MERSEDAERDGIEKQREAQDTGDADLEGEGEKRQLAGESRRAWAAEQGSDEAGDAPPGEERDSDER